MDIVAVRGDVLHVHREHIGQPAGGPLHDVQQLLGQAEDIALLHRLGDSEAPGIDNPVALGGVDGEDGVQLGGDLLLIDLVHVHGGAHEGHGVVGLGGGVRADVGGDKDVAREDVPLLPHVQQLGGDG